MRLFTQLFISTIVHLALWLLFGFATYQPPEDRVIELEVYNSSMNQKKPQFVSDLEVPKNLKSENDPENKADLFSAKKIRVQKQTRAANIGATRNRSNSIDDAQAPSLASKTQQKKIELDPRKVGTLDFQKPSNIKHQASSELQKRNSVQIDKGISTIGEVLPTDIEVGAFTALNTDQHLFYTFYARINEMIRFRWESAIRSSLSTASFENFAFNSSGIWTTHLEVILDKNGFIKDIIIARKSGFKGFDGAAVFAFRDSKAFLNPPAEMLNSEDGLIHLKYAFQVHFEPKVLVRSRQQ